MLCIREFTKEIKKETLTGNRAIAPTGTQIKSATHALGEYLNDNAPIGDERCGRKGLERWVRNIAGDYSGLVAIHEGLAYDFDSHLRSAALRKAQDRSAVATWDEAFPGGYTRDIYRSDLSKAWGGSTELATRDWCSTKTICVSSHWRTDE